MTKQEQDYTIVQEIIRLHSTKDLATIMLFLQFLKQRKCNLDIRRINNLIREMSVSRYQ